MKKLAGGFAIGLAVLVGGIYGVWKWQYPYGVRTCRVRCISSDLQGYAVAHWDRFPDGEPTPLRSLQKLYGETTIDYPPLLAGLSGNEASMEARLKAGQPLDDSVSSWIYWPGFKSDDDPDLAILWERKSGLRWNAKRSSDRDGHSVVFAGGYHRYVAGAEWSDFTNKQAALRSTILATRSTSATEAKSGHQ